MAEPTNESPDVALAIIKTDISYIKGSIQNINHQLGENYLTRQEGEILRARLKLLEKVVYGMSGAVATIVVAYAVKVFVK